MVRTQVRLTEEQDRGLKDLAARSGRRQSDLVREAIDHLLATHKAPEGDWRAAFEAVRGIWADRDDLDELYRELRGEVEERVEPLAKR